MYVFISHSSKDVEVANDVCSMIEKNGHKCFLAPRDIRSGYEYAEEIVTGIDNSQVMILLLSAEANNSPHVLREIERAVSKKIPIIVYKMEEVTLSKSMEYFLMTHQWINFKSGGHYKEIVDSINKYDENPGKTASTSDAVKTTPITIKSNKRNTIIAVVIAAIALLCVAGVATGIALSSERDKRPVDLDNVNSESISVTENTASSSAQSTTTNATTKPQTTSVTTEPTSATTEPTSSTTKTTTETTLATTTQSTTLATTTSTTTLPPVVSEPSPTISVELGDSITMGTYNGEPILWRVLKLSDDGKKAVILSDKIISMKAFDSCEGGRFNYCDGEYYYDTPSSEMTPEFERDIRGDNRWEFSNIRTWLNSNKTNVVYQDNPPVATAMCEKTNGYNTEAGFLKSFTDEELSAILTTQVETNGIVTEDKVFLLSLEEYKWLIDADIAKYATPTDAAVEKDSSNWYKLNVNEFGITDHYWWLRDADTTTASKVYFVNYSYSGEELETEPASLEGYGIRPAMTIDLTSEHINVN